MALSIRGYDEDWPLDVWREKRSLSGIEGGMDRFFNEVFGGPLVSCAAPDMRGVFSPSIDIKETHDALEVSAEMPGMSQDDIEVSVHDGMLTISGEKKVQKEKRKTDYHYAERSYGSFCRDICLPDLVESDKAQAAYRNGVLTVTLPKTEKAMKESRKIPVTAA
jgi:HSP20 family protein